MPISKSEMEIRRKRILEEAFNLFVQYSIDSVTFQNIADAAGVGVASVYRYYPNKLDLAVAVCCEKWGQFLAHLPVDRPMEMVHKIPAIDRLNYFLDQDIELYTNHKDLLVFNENFNFYIKREKLDQESLNPYNQVAKILDDRFHFLYEKAREDHTVRTDIPEVELKHTILNTMLAACTFYAKGVTWDNNSETDFYPELLRLKAILIDYAKN
ncbi:MAG: TetR/AcrR family transcriptional regulator [Sphaerochaetaceae bacterium]|nr:TetR/AcrR family transcriptional regulator [Sphaerochaetaceae bacterium]